jgi:uncharacterized protein (TIRG00374 family)
MRHKWFFQLIGVLMFVYILYKVDVRHVVSLLLGARYAILAIALALTLGFVVLKAVRWKYLLAMQGVEYETKECFLAYLAGMYAGLVTPGHLGDFVKVIYLRTDKGVTLGRGFSSVFADRLFDLLILIAMAFSGALALALTRNMLIVILVWVLVFMATVLIFLNERSGKRIVRAAFRVFMPKKLGSGLEEQFEDFYSGIGQFKRIEILVPLLLSIVTYFIMYVQCSLIANALGISISLLNIAFCISAANLVSLLPISITGIGTRDATLIAMFSILHLSRESALSFSITFLFISNISACVIGAIAWFRKPLRVRV